MGGRELIADLVGATGLPLNPILERCVCWERAKSTRSVHFSGKPFTRELWRKKFASSQCKDIVISQLRWQGMVNYWKAVRRRWVRCEKAELVSPARKVCTGMNAIVRVRMSGFP